MTKESKTIPAVGVTHDHGHGTYTITAKRKDTGEAGTAQIVLAQVTKDGQIVKTIPLELESSIPFHIAYSASHDQIWVSDSNEAKHRIIRLTLAAPTGIQAVDDAEETVTFEANFKNLEAQVMGPGGKPAGKGVEVVFKIVSGDRSAAFGQGERAVSEYNTLTDDRGIARAGLRALHVAGDVNVRAHPKSLGPAHSAVFKPRHVVPLPDTILGSNTMNITVGQPSQLYTMTVVAGQQKTPVPNVVVEVAIVILDPGASGVHFESKNEHPIDTKHLSVRIRTNEKGQASIGNGAEWYIVSPTPGNVKVTFKVIEPSGATATKDIIAGVMPAL